jgi:dihydropyrimidinase
MYDLCIKNGQVYQNNTYTKTNIYVKDGVIRLFSEEKLDADVVYDAKSHLVLPGLIDPHVHFDLDLGLIRSRDNFYSGSKIAALGGVTTIIDFLNPINQASDLVNALQSRLLEAENCQIDYKFHVTVKNPKGQVKEIVQKMKELELNSVKLFTTYSDSLRRTYDNEIKELLLETKKEDILVLAHIENDELIQLDDTMTYHDLLESRPTVSETSEALKLAKLVKDTSSKLYMVHLSSGKTLQALKNEFPDVLNTQFMIESCPHYFIFNKDVWDKKGGYLYTMAPPLRTANEQQLLRDMIDDVYTIGTDHCSFNSLDKQNKSLSKMPLGVGGIEHSFDMMYQLFEEKIIPKMTEHVAKVHHLYPKKGVLQVGSDADIMIYELNDGFVDEHHGASDYSIYTGKPTKGRVISTISRGQFVVKDRVFLGHHGQYVGGHYESNH